MPLHSELPDRKLCVTCKWHKTGAYNEPKYSRCRQPEILAIFGDKVFGELPYCLDMRGSSGGCGLDGSKHEREIVGHG